MIRRDKTKRHAMELLEDQFLMFKATFRFNQEVLIHVQVDMMKSCSTMKAVFLA